MKIKIKDKNYETAKIPQYNKLVGMLEILFSNNPKRFNFHGIVDKGRLGVLVCGEDKKGVREFQKFYSINDINFYFNKYIRQIKKHGERRLT